MFEDADAPLGNAHEQLDARRAADADGAVRMRDLSQKHPWGVSLAVPVDPERQEQDACRASAGVLHNGIVALASTLGRSPTRTMKRLALAVGVPPTRIRSWAENGIPIPDMRRRLFNLIEQVAEAARAERIAAEPGGERTMRPAHDV